MKPFYYISIVIVVTSLACRIAVPVSMDLPVNTNKPATVNTGDSTAESGSLVVCKTDVINGGLRLREEAGQDKKELAILKEGTEVTRTDAEPVIITVIPWYQVTVNDMTGWAFSANLCEVK